MDKVHIIDTHCHIYHLKEKEFYSYAEHASNAGVDGLIAIGADFATSKISMKFAENIKNAWFTAGVHPHDAEKFETESIKQENISDDYLNFEVFFNHPLFVAVGEIGLDYFYEYSGKNIQKSVFEYFLKLALKFKKPVCVHCRDKNGKYDAYKDIYERIREFANCGGRFVIHCFTGNIEWCKRFLDTGGYIGITGIVTFPKSMELREIIKFVPVERLFLETDTPYLAPVPYRGKRNCSAYLKEIAEFVAKEKSISFEKLCEITTDNAITFFNLLPEFSGKN